MSSEAAMIARGPMLEIVAVAFSGFIGAIFLAAGNLTADLIRAWVDPRIREL